MKPADILRRIAPVGTMGAHERVCAALLDECERLAADLIRWDDREGRDPWEPLIANARATLAKLRGER